MMTADQIVALWTQRKSECSAVKQQMALLAEHYQGSVLVPIPEMETNSRATVANLVQQGLDETAMRIASTPPMIWCPPAQPKLETSKKRAAIRQKALYGVWEENAMELKLDRRARHLIGYGQSPVVWRADVKRGIPVCAVRDPMTCYPSDLADDAMVPDDVIFTYQRRAGWVRNRYPEQYSQLGRKRDASPETMLTVLEYHDGAEVVLLVVSDYGAEGSGYTGSGWASPQGNPAKAFKAVLERAENRTGAAQVVIPGRITLGAIMGQFDGVLPMFTQRAHLEALQTIAVEKTIFPDAYLVSRANEVAKFIAGPFDGRTGQVNVVEGGVVEYINAQSSPQVNVAIDRLERNERISSGVPAAFGGEAPSNIRTGRMGDSVISAQIDFGIQEHQKILARSLTHENKIAVAIFKAHFGDTAKSFHVSWKNAQGPVDFTPNVDFDSDVSVVTFPAAGQDQAGLTIQVGQLLGMELISTETARDLHPLISDPAREQQRVMIGQVDKAILASVLALAQGGQLAPQDAALLKRRLVLGDTIEDALDLVQKKAQERQAPSVEPVAPDSPAAQPGMAPVGAGAEAGVVVPNQNTGDIANLLADLRGPQRLSPAERPRVA